MKKQEKSKKSQLVVTKVTTYLTGSVKNKFFEEIERTGALECHLAREIITLYYSTQRR